MAVSARASKRAKKEQPVSNKMTTIADGPARDDGIAPLIVFAHGAGVPSSSEWMQRWKKLLESATGAVEVVTFDYPYCANGKRGSPPKAEKLIGPHVEEIKKAQSVHPGHPLVLIGKSMGSRVSCMVASSGQVEVSAVVCLGYPLKGTINSLRDGTLLELRVPTMFVQGSKDSLCPLNKLQEIQEKMECMTMLHVVEGGDHSMKVSKSIIKEGGKSQDEIDKEAADNIQTFLNQVLGKKT